MKQNIFQDSGYFSKKQPIPKTRKALIIHSGALGDCILTLHLCDFVKKHLKITQLDFIGNLDRIGFMPGRTSVDKIRSLEAIPLSKMFVDPSDFAIDENDRLIADFANYEWVLNFMGEKGGNFEQNLIYTLYYTRSSDVATLSSTAPKDYPGHISHFHLEEFIHDKQTTIEAFTTPSEWNVDFAEPMIIPTESDTLKGKEIVQNKTNLSNSDLEKIVIIAPGSGSTKKCWHIDNYIEICRKISASGMKPLYILGPVEQDRFSKETMEKLKKSTEIITNLPINDLVALLSQAKAFIGNDSGTSHLAANIGIPTLTIFGPTDSVRYRPLGPMIKVTQQSEDSFQASNPTSIQTVFNEFQTLLGN